MAEQRLHQHQRDRRRSGDARRGADPPAPPAAAQSAGHRFAGRPRRARLLGPSARRTCRLPFDAGRPGQAAGAVADARPPGTQGARHRARCRRRLRRQEPDHAGGRCRRGARAEGRASGALDRGSARASAGFAARPRPHLRSHDLRRARRHASRHRRRHLHRCRRLRAVADGRVSGSEHGVAQPDRALSHAPFEAQRPYGRDQQGADGPVSRRGAAGRDLRASSGSSTRSRANSAASLSICAGRTSSPRRSFPTRPPPA